MDAVSANVGAGEGDAGAGAMASAGWLTAAEAARRLGVTLGTFRNARWRGWAALRPFIRYVRPSTGGGRRALYPVDVVERLAVELATPTPIPDGFLSRDEACARLGVPYTTLHRWEREGRIGGGARGGEGRGKIFARDEIERLVAACGAFSPPYVDPARPGVWRVPLHGHGMTRREAIIDEADRAIVEGSRLHWSERGTGGAGQVMLWTGTEHVRLRQAILGIRDAESRIGHVNGDPLDCRRENLIVRTRQEVERGNGKKKQYAGRPCSSRFKGVCFEKYTGRWRVGIVVDGREIRLGRFHDELAAAEAYDAAARELFGEHARLNFPDGVDAWLEQATAPARAAA